MSIDIQKVSDFGKAPYFIVADEMGVFQGSVTVEGESTGRSARPNLDFLELHKDEILKKIKQCMGNQLELEIWI